MATLTFWNIVALIIERKARSKCCGAKVEIMESEMPDSGSRMQKLLGYRCEECNKPTKVK